MFPKPNLQSLFRRLAVRGVQRQRRSRIVGKPVRQLVRGVGVVPLGPSLTPRIGYAFPLGWWGLITPPSSTPTRPPPSPACRPLDPRWSDRTEQACGFIPPDPAYRSTQRAWFDGRKYEPGGATSNPRRDRVCVETCTERVPIVGYGDPSGNPMRFAMSNIGQTVPCRARNRDFRDGSISGFFNIG